MISAPLVRNFTLQAMPPASAFPNQALALLPRSLRLSPTTKITRSHVLKLYREELKVAHSFQSYNFRQYFVRRTRNKFRTELPALLDAAFSQSSSSSSSSSPAARSATATSSSSSSSPSTSTSTSTSASSASAPSESSEDDASIYSPSGSTGSSLASSAAAAEQSSEPSTPEERLRAWYRDSLVELGVLARSAVVNRMYEAPKLVVEGRNSHLSVAGGGGAGMEASYGGGGQPAEGDVGEAKSSAQQT